MDNRVISSPVDELIDQLGSFIASLGINRVAGQMYVLLFLSEQALSLDEMTLRLRVSKGHVSTNIRALERWRAVRRVVVRGSRKDYYEANRDTVSVIFDQLQQGLTQRLDQVQALVQSVRKQLADDSAAVTSAELPSLKKRLSEIEAMQRLVHGVVNNLSVIKSLLKIKGKHS